MSSDPSTRPERASIAVALIVPTVVMIAVLFGTWGRPEATVGAVLICSVMATVCGHFVFGYNWARWLLAGFTLVFALVQVLVVTRPLFAVAMQYEAVPLLVFLALTLVAAANAVVLLSSRRVKDYLASRRAGVTRVQLRLLRMARWATLIVVLVGIAVDLVHLLQG